MTQPTASPVAALHAADACRAAAAALRDCAEERGRLAAVARIDWQGPRREAFDVELAAVERAGATLESELLALATTLEQTAAALRRDTGGGGGW